jgi:sec-independent protein translocase protein TatA
MVMILVVALLVFGPSKLPQLGDALGKGIRNFKKATESDDDAPVAGAPQAQLASSARPASSPAGAQTVAVEKGQS